MKKVLFIIMQCTWGLAQTLIGLGFFMANRKCNHRMYHGCIDTQWNHPGGLSLGLFIFTPVDSQENSERIRVHEYGHAIQSLFLGPFMFFVGVISVSWGNMPYFAKLRKNKHLPYTACFVESWASRLGEWATKEAAIWE